MTTNIDADQSQQMSSGASEVSAPVSMPAAVSAPAMETQVEKSVPQSQVNSVVGRVRQEGEQKGYNQGWDAAMQQFQQKQPPQAVPGMGGMSQTQDIASIVREQVKGVLSEHHQNDQVRKQQEWANQVSTEFETKLQAAKANHADFDTVMKNVSVDSFPHAAIMGLGLENTGEVFYELAKSPAKLANIDNLARIDFENAQRGRQTNMAFQEMKRLEDSIKLTAQAANVRTPNEPLSQLQPSSVGKDSGSMGSVRDYRKLLLSKHR